MTTLEATGWPTTDLEFNELVGRHKPAVFRGLASAWLPEGLSTSEAILDWLVDLLGNTVVPVSTGLPGDGGLVGAAGIKGRSLSTTFSGTRLFSDVARQLIDESRSPTGHLIYIQSIVLPELLPYLRLPLSGCPAVSSQWRTWIGSGNHRVGIHVDGDENFYCLLHGRKSFLLFPFDALADLSVGPMDGGPYGPPCSSIDPKKPDFSAHPRYRQALEKAVTVELGPGDVLYLPCHWWHSVESFGVNVACNYWWRQVDETAIADAHATFLRTLLFLRPLPRHWRSYWRTMIETFSLFGDEPPYPHLAPEDQGAFGVGTPARLSAIAGAIREAENSFLARSTALKDLMSTPHKLASTVSFHPVADNRTLLKTAGRSSEESIPNDLFQAVASFAVARTPDDVITNAGADRQALEELFERLVRNGYLRPVIGVR